MPHFNKRLWRAAASIQQWVPAQAGHPPSISLTGVPWFQLQKCVRQITEAQRRNFGRTANRLLTELLCQAEHLQQDLGALASRVRQEASHPEPPSQADIYRDLQTIEEEFNGVSCNPDARTLSVVTPRIVLRDIDLGPFRIELEFHACHRSPEYRVIALEPHPAASDERVTHPHVHNDELCAGEGLMAIQKALEQGRLWDFFQIVSRILENYAPGQAFVELDAWSGSNCPECGCFLAESDECLCYGCDTTLCSDCRSFCRRCEEAYCNSCLTSCAHCDSDCCRHCLERCTTCGLRVCGDCREDDICNKCRDQGDSDHEEDCDEHFVPADICHEESPQPAANPAV